MTKVFDIRDYNKMVGAPTLHPLVGVVNLGELPPVLFNTPPRVFGYYAVYIKGPKYTELHYGNRVYDYNEGALVFFAPGQVAGSECDGLRHRVQGYVLMFHPDLLVGTPLQNAMKSYGYFSYNTDEALFPTEREKGLLIDIFGKIGDELRTDAPDMVVVVDYIKLVLDYCLRLYDRQIHDKTTADNDILARFEQLCDDYYQSDAPRRLGLLSVQHCADMLCMSPNYLSDAVRKYTGVSPQKHIRQKTLARAKELLTGTSKRINEIAEELGFRQPQNFSAWFRNVEGHSPNKYRQK